jgi:hypothetical protein
MIILEGGRSPHRPYLRAATDNKISKEIVIEHNMVKK